MGGFEDVRNALLDFEAVGVAFFELAFAREVEVAGFATEEVGGVVGVGRLVFEVGLDFEAAGEADADVEELVLRDLAFADLFEGDAVFFDAVGVPGDAFGEEGPEDVLLLALEIAQADAGAVGALPLLGGEGLEEVEELGFRGEAVGEAAGVAEGVVDDDHFGRDDGGEVADFYLLARVGGKAGFVLGGAKVGGVDGDEGALLFEGGEEVGEGLGLSVGERGNEEKGAHEGEAVGGGHGRLKVELWLRGIRCGKR